MPWFCSELIAEYKPALLKAWRNVDAFEGRLYHVTDLSGHDFGRKDNKHGLPERGLLFVRNLEPAPWWDDAGGYSLINSIPHRGATLTIEYPETHRLLLQFAKYCSVNFRCTIAHYSAFSWGGPLESENTRLFLPSERQIFRDQERGLTINQAEDGTVSATEKDHLAITLEYFDVISPTGYFAPHTRHFDWKRHAIQS